MSFQRPTLTELAERIRADFVSKLDLVGAVLRRSNVYVLASVVAGAAHMLHGHLEFLGRQLFPDQSDDEFLIRQASLFGLAKNAPGYAQATIEATGTLDGEPIPEGSLLVSSGGFEYETDEEVTIAGGVASVGVTALLAGADSTLPDGAILSFESPIATVGATVEVTSSDEDGTDEETTEELRVRLLERMAEPEHGGSEPDYIAWAKEVAGVTRAWVYPLELGAGTVLVRFMRDDDVTPIPSSPEVATVQDYLDSVKPAHATVTAAAPIDAPLDVEITGLLPDTSDMRDAVEAELADLLRRESEPGETTKLSAIHRAIGNTAGLEDYTLTDPVADVTHTTGELASLGTVTFL